MTSILIYLLRVFLFFFDVHFGARIHYMRQIKVKQAGHFQYFRLHIHFQQPADHSQDQWLQTIKSLPANIKVKMHTLYKTSKSPIYVKEYNSLQTDCFQICLEWGLWYMDEYGGSCVFLQASVLMFT